METYLVQTVKTVTALVTIQAISEEDAIHKVNAGGGDTGESQTSVTVTAQTKR